jgi:hypothetical protein
MERVGTPELGRRFRLLRRYANGEAHATGGLGRRSGAATAIRERKQKLGGPVGGRLWDKPRCRRPGVDANGEESDGFRYSKRQKTVSPVKGHLNANLGP